MGFDVLLCVMFIRSTYGGQKKALFLLELELALSPA